MVHLHKETQDAPPGEPCCHERKLTGMSLFALLFLWKDAVNDTHQTDSGPPPSPWIPQPPEPQAKSILFINYSVCGVLQFTKMNWGILHVTLLNQIVPWHLALKMQATPQVSEHSLRIFIYMNLPTVELILQFWKHFTKEEKHETNFNYIIFEVFFSPTNSI